MPTMSPPAAGGKSRPALSQGARCSGTVMSEGQSVAKRGRPGPMIWQLIRCLVVGPIVHYRTKTKRGDFGEVSLDELGSHEDAGLKLDQFGHKLLLAFAIGRQ